MEFTRTLHTFASTTTGVVVGVPDFRTIRLSLPLSTTSLGCILMENSLQNSSSFPLRIIPLQASEASPPNSEINDKESLAMLPIDFSAVALLPEMRAISERKG